MDSSNHTETKAESEHSAEKEGRAAAHRQHAAQRHGFGLAKRIALAFAALITIVAFAYSIAIRWSIEVAERHLVTNFLEELFVTAVDDLRAGHDLDLGSFCELYGSAPNIKPATEAMTGYKPGFNEITTDPAQFLFKGSWEKGELVLVCDQVGFEETERDIWFHAGSSVVVVFLISMLLGVFLSRLIMRPVERLSAEVRRSVHLIGTDRYRSIDPRLMTNDEMGELARTCDSAMHRLNEALKREKAFTGDVSHELRTPLAVIQSSAELLSMSDLGARQREQVERIVRYSNRMRELLTLFLHFARNGASSKLNADADTVKGLFALMDDVWRDKAAQKGIEFDIRTEATCPGTYSPVFLGTVLNNLVKNAVLYVPSGSRIVVTERKDGFTVEDNGPGIAPQERERIFRDFTRGANATGEGEGLGLSIAARVCDRMGWRIELLPSETGAHFRVTVVDVEDRESKPLRADERGEAGAS